MCNTCAPSASAKSIATVVLVSIAVVCVAAVIQAFMILSVLRKIQHAPPRTVPVYGALRCGLLADITLYAPDSDQQKTVPIQLLGHYPSL